MKTPMIATVAYARRGVKQEIARPAAANSTEMKSDVSRMGTRLGRFFEIPSTRSGAWRIRPKKSSACGASVNSMSAATSAMSFDSA